jgi:hypothetical protein
VYEEGTLVDSAVVGINFVGDAVLATQTSAGQVQVTLATMTCGRVALEVSYPITGAGIYQVAFDYIWLDPSGSWNAPSKEWRLAPGVYEIGTNITMRDNPNLYAVRIVDMASNTILATSNSLSHIPSDYEHTTHLSTIVEFTNNARVAVLLDLPNIAACTVVGSYATVPPLYYAAFDAAICVYTLTDFWFHRII